MSNLELYHRMMNPFDDEAANKRLWHQHVWHDPMNDEALPVGISNFTSLEIDGRALSLAIDLDELQKRYPDSLRRMRTVLEPGAGAGGMTIHLYNYFRQYVFGPTFPTDFQHIGLEIAQASTDWYQEQMNLESFGFPLNSDSKFSRHYQLRKAVDYLEFAKQPENWGTFDGLFAISLYDLLIDEQEATNLFSLTRKLLKPDGVFVLFATTANTLGDDPAEAGFKSLSGNKAIDRHTSIWQAI